MTYETQGKGVDPAVAALGLPIGALRRERAAGRCWLLHRWSKWRQYVAHGEHHGLVVAPRETGVPFTRQRQARTCFRCGLTEDRRVEK